MCLLILSAAAFSHSLDGLQLSWGFLPQLCKIRGGNFDCASFFENHKLSYDFFPYS